MDGQNLRIEIGIRSDQLDPSGQAWAHKAQAYFGRPCGPIRLFKVFHVSLPELKHSESWIHQSLRSVFSDPVLEWCEFKKSVFRLYEQSPSSLALEKFYLPGVTDSQAQVARQALSLVFAKAVDRFEVASGQLLVFCDPQGGELTKEQILGFGNAVFANPLIEQLRMLEPAKGELDQAFAKVKLPRMKVHDSFREIEKFNVSMSSASWDDLIKERFLFLNRAEIAQIQKLFSDESFLDVRREYSLDSAITDAELEVIAQTWSEHCKHKIFAAQIDFEDQDNPSKSRIIDSVFSTYIKATTEQIQFERNDDFLVSTFTDNSGVIRFNDNWDICFKVETHNSPSALDPYGGALTGIVGVNRDILGTGLGAKPILNTNVLCFGPLDWSGELPPGIMHPSRIASGVILGIEDGGNQSGIPTVNGSIHFHESYLGKPLVYCGTAGLIPRKVNGLEAWDKYVRPEDLVVMVGGRIGKDGIHGATVSSAPLEESSPSQVVQLGDPFTQKKVVDFILEARDRGLISGLTDNGAGGLSSSVGEMATLTGGVTIDLSKAKTKYIGLNPWELLISESQERMTVAIRPGLWQQFSELAARHDVEVSALGRFTTSGFFHVTYDDDPICLLPLHFLHEQCPRLKLKASWSDPEKKKELAPLNGSHHLISDWSEILLGILSDPNVSTREAVIRRFDHEVQGTSVLKPLAGILQNAPMDAGVIKPLHESTECVVVSHGLNPWLSERSPYLMAVASVDEAIRNAVAVGMNPGHAAILDNYCWPDPIFDPLDNPDGAKKLAQLVLASEGLRDAALAYGLPMISGKDSMKNDYRYPANHPKAGTKVSVMPTLLISLIGCVDSASHVVTSDFKRRGNIIYEFGDRARSLGGSVFERKYAAKPFPLVGAVDLNQNMKLYRVIHQLMQSELIEATHDISDGGLIAAVAESCVGGQIGVDLLFDESENFGKSDLVVRLFGEDPGRFVVEVKPENTTRVEQALGQLPYRRVGMVGSMNLNVRIGSQQETPVFSVPVHDLSKAYTGGVFQWRK